MKSNTNRRKLRNFFISKDLQRPMIVAHSAYLLYVVVAVIATVLSPYYIDIFKTGDLWVQHFSAKMFIVLLERLSITGLFIMVISFFHFFIFTHKFCGPLVYIGRTIAKISERDFSRKIYLRKGDFLKIEAKQINTMMTALSNSIEVIKRENLLLLEDIEESIQACGRKTEMDAKLKGFQDRADRCRVHLDNFQLIGESTNKVCTGQRQQLVSDKPLSANECL